jgi:HSP20 family molecular chaperone IbpA
MPDQQTPVNEEALRQLQWVIEQAMAEKKKADDYAARQPKVQVTTDSNGGAHLTADMAGVTQDDLHVEIKGDKLHLWGTSRSSSNPGDFDELVQLPNGVNAATATATIEAGVFRMDIAANAVQISPTGGTA